MSILADSEEEEGSWCGLDPPHLALATMSSSLPITLEGGCLQRSGLGGEDGAWSGRRGIVQKGEEDCGGGAVWRVCMGGVGT